MKTIKKNNKGFSLVELIVVILIMAIIAVALAPQVMKWVDESKVSADNSNKAILKSTVDAAVADYMHEQNKKIDAAVTVKVKEGAMTDGTTSFTQGTATAGTTLAHYIAKTMNYQYPGVEQDNAGFFQVEIAPGGGVTVKIMGSFSGADGSGTY